MICDNCKEGGSLLKDALAATGKMRQILFGAIRDSHDKCTNPATCPCQHKIEKITK